MSAPAPSTTLAATSPDAEPAAAVAARGPWALAWTRIRRDHWALVGLAVVVLLLLAGLLAPLLTRLEGQDPYTYRLGLLDDARGNVPRGALGGVSGAHWFGVEPLTGRDLFAIVVYGLRTSLLVGLAATVISVGIGALVGLTAAYFGGWVDGVLSRFTDVVLAFPGLIFMIALTVLVPASVPRVLVIVGVIAAFGWTAAARVVRAQTLSLMTRDFVTVARGMGAGAHYVIGRELLPNIVGTLSVFATIAVPAAVGTEAALSFLGVGVTPPTPDLGRSIQSAVPWVQSDVMYLLFPGAALFLAVLGFNLLGEGLRSAIDPRSGSRVWSPRRSRRPGP